MNADDNTVYRCTSKNEKDGNLATDLTFDLSLAFNFQYVRN